MATSRGKQREPSPRAVRGDEAITEVDERELEPGGSLKPIPEFVRRAIGMGLAGFFTTEEAVRKAFGDTIPKDWTDFLVETSDRTRSEFLERLSHEMGRVLENIDLAEVMRGLLEGRTLEVKAEFRLSDRNPKRSTDVRFTDAKIQGDE